MIPPRLALAALATFALVPGAMGEALSCTAPAEALDARDTARIEDFVQSRTRGLAEAMLGPEADRETVSALYAPGIEAIETLPDGDYRCRTIKMGGISPLIVYGYFDCTVSEDATRIDKTSGSQRFSGDLTPSAGGLFYRGALHYGDEQPIAYGSDAERNQVGCLYQVAGKPRRYLLELPSPQFESTHDVIEMIPD